MEWWLIALLAVVGVIALVLVSAFVVWRMATGRTKRLARRVGALSWRAKLDLARRLMVDNRIPAPVRLIVPLLVLYLALPLDLIPDFIPVIGQLDDILVIVIGIAMLARFVPSKVLDQHLSELEPGIDVQALSERPRLR